MNRVNLAVCDRDEMYCTRLCEYLRDHLELSFDIHSFTEADKLLGFSEENRIHLLIISEQVLATIDRDRSHKPFRNIIVLDEENPAQRVAEEQEPGRIKYVNKYMPAAKIIDSVLDFCTDAPDEFSDLGVKRNGARCSVIGFFTPLSRTGQTSLAISMGEMLAKEKKTMFLSFESFSSLPGILGVEPESDITDLLYYSGCEKEKFCLYLEKIKFTRNGLDYVAPAGTSQQIREFKSTRITELIDLLAREAGYEYIILDLKEYPEDFFDVLALCDVIYSLNRSSQQDQYRMGSYNRILAQNGYEDILSKTVKCGLPGGKDLSQVNELAAKLLLEYKEGRGRG